MKYRFQHAEYPSPTVCVRGGETARFEDFHFDTDDDELAKLLRESAAPGVTQIKPKPRASRARATTQADED